MKSRINIRLSMEEAEADAAAAAAASANGTSAQVDADGAPLLNVDIEANLTPEQKAARDLALKTVNVDGTPVEDEPVDPANSNAPAPAPEPSPAPAPTPASDEVPDEPAAPTEEPGEAVELPVEGGDDVDSDPVKETIAESEGEAQNVDDAIAAAVTLEALADTLTRSLKFSGLTPAGARALNSVANNVTARLSMEGYVEPLPAAESYDTLSARRVQTRLAVEGIADRVGKIWESISKSFVRMARHLKILLDSIAFTYKRNRNQIRALKISLLDARSNEAKDAQFTNRRALDGLSIKGVFSPTQSVSIMKDLVHGMRTVNIPAGGAALMSSGDVSQLQLTGAKVFPLGLAAVGTSDKLVSRYCSAKPLPGNQQFIIDLPKTGLSPENMALALGKVRATIGSSGNVVPVSGLVMKKNEISGFLQNLEGLNNELMSAWKAANKVHEIVVRFDDKYSGNAKVAVGMIAGSVATGGNPLGAIAGAVIGNFVGGKLQSQNDRETLLAVRAINEAFLNVPTRALVMGASTVNAGIAYANTSIRQYA